jgi:hypothetical protein
MPAVSSCRLLKLTWRWPLVGLCQVCVWLVVCEWIRPPVKRRELLGGIRPAELAAIGGRLEGFAAEVFESLPRKDQRARGEC